MSKDLPPGWRSIKVREAGSVQLGRQRSPDVHRGTNMRPYLRVANVYEDRIDLSDVMEMHFEPKEVERFELKPGDILLNEGQSRELVGRPAMYRGELPGACFTNSLVRFQASNVVEPMFALGLFRHWLKSRRFQAIGQITTNIAHLGAGRFAEMDFPLPPLNEQRRIVAKLETLESRGRRARAALDAVPPLLEKLRQSILAAAFRGDLTKDWRAKNKDVEPATELLKRIRVDRRKEWEASELAKLKARGKAPTDDRWKARYKEGANLTAPVARLPAGWAASSIDSVGDLLLGRRRAGEEYVEGKEGRVLRPYVRVANVKEDRLDLTDVLEMPFNDAELVVYRLEPGDIILSEGQSAELVGQSATYEGGLENLCIQATVHRFRALSTATTPAFAQLVFLHHLHAGVFMKAAALTTNIAHLTSERLKPLPFPLPPLAEQTLIVERVRRALTRIRALEGVSASLARDHRSLERATLAKAFRGELVPQDSCHPAVRDVVMNGDTRHGDRQTERQPRSQTRKKNELSID